MYVSSDVIIRIYFFTIYMKVYAKNYVKHDLVSRPSHHPIVSPCQVEQQWWSHWCLWRWSRETGLPIKRYMIPIPIGCSDVPSFFWQPIEINRHIKFLFVSLPTGLWIEHICRYWELRKSNRVFKLREKSKDPQSHSRHVTDVRRCLLKWIFMNPMLFFSLVLGTTDGFGRWSWWRPGVSVFFLTIYLSWNPNKHDLYSWQHWQIW